MIMYHQQRQLTVEKAIYLAGVFFLSGCTSLGLAPTANTPTSSTPVSSQPTPQQAASFEPRDYFFPSSTTMRQAYNFAMSADFPPGSYSASYVATSSTTIEVLSLSSAQATLRSSTIGDGTVGSSAVSSSTASFTVRADGSVIAGNNTYSKEMFTSAGAIVAPASGSQIAATRYALIGAESVTVPAGTFNCSKLQVTMATSSFPSSFGWYAKGAGLVKMNMLSTASLPSGVATFSVTMTLRSFTP